MRGSPHAGERRAVRLALEHPYCQDGKAKSHREIAEHCGVSQPFVSKIVNEITIDNRYHSPQKSQVTRPSPTADLAPDVREALATPAARRGGAARDAGKCNIKNSCEVLQILNKWSKLVLTIDIALQRRVLSRREGTARASRTPDQAGVPRRYLAFFRSLEVNRC